MITDKDSTAPSDRSLVKFEELISTYSANKIGLSDLFLTEDLATNLAANILTLQSKKLMVAAGTGNDTEIAHDSKVRGDSIYWLDRKHNDPFENIFFDLMDQFIVYLNNSCYTGITGYEFHYALYEKGSFYRKHLDQFKNDESRQFSMICYLNEGWLSSDGGELTIQALGKEESISPMNQKAVFFKSNELVHEVMLTQKNRMSITGWLKRD